LKERILSGFRSTGKLHLGNLLGALENWVNLQDDYDCFFEIANWHALTTAYENTKEHKELIREVAIDWLASGLDPERSTIFIQSDVPEHSELFLLLGMFVPLPWLERNPTLKEQVRDLNLQDKVNYGLLGYPVLQAADILVYRATTVPVGDDQVPHLELTREIARRFNSLYDKVFPEPKPLLTQFPRVKGIDGKKMSKSLNNTILLSDSSDDLKKKVMNSYTDPKKIRKHDPGNPEGCPIYEYHTIFNSDESPNIRRDCKRGHLGCVDCKGKLYPHVFEGLAPYREKREELADDPKKLDEILNEGGKKARNAARETMTLARDAMHLWQ
jgi:tryptophanyl-tRNA synthetase